MARKELIVALSIIVAASPVSAAIAGSRPMGPPPTENADARYCMHVEPATGSRIETVECWTRAEWTDQGVNVDQDWAKEGVAVIS